MSVRGSVDCKGLIAMWFGSGQVHQHLRQCIRYRGTFGTAVPVNRGGADSSLKPMQIVLARYLPLDKQKSYLALEDDGG